MIQTEETFFAPAERLSTQELEPQVNMVLDQIVFKKIFDTVPVFVAILNKQRQIIYSNKVLTQFLGLENFSPLIGKRPGEALNCIHANECAGGCGTSEACSVCGAVDSILISQKNGSATNECRILLDGNKSLDLLVWTNEYKIDSETFTILAATDISDEKRKHALERIFFHDLLNTTGALKGMLELLKMVDEDDKEEYITISQGITEGLIYEIMSQRELIMAENDELKIHTFAFTTKKLLEEVIMLYERHELAKNKKLVLSKDLDDVIVYTDKTLLRRVIGNLTKNALESSSVGETVTLNCTEENDIVEFQVHNEKRIPRNVQLQIFQRSFSTKGEGRGLGTYSVKLLTEKYLKGSVRFSTSEKNGTTFYVKCPLEIGTCE